MTSPKKRSQFTTVVDTLKILNPINPQDPIDAPMIAALADLSTKQASRYLSLLHRTGYLMRVGTLNHFAQYVRTQKALPRTSASICRHYKRRLAVNSRRHYTPSANQIAREVSRAVIAALKKELRGRAVSHATARTSQQLTLFKGA